MATNKDYAQTEWLIAKFKAGEFSKGYTPTIRDAGEADVFDGAMESLGLPNRAWRGSKPARNAARSTP